MNISVVIPTYNRGYCIANAVNSVLEQTLPALEIIVVDDGSSDNTLSTLKVFQDKIKILCQENKGVSAARNAGIKEARGEWIALLDSDDTWLPGKLKDHDEFLKKHEHLQIFQCEELWVRNGKRVNPKNKHQKKHGWIFLNCLPLCIVSPSAVVFRKSLWLEINGFDEEFAVCEDYDLWLRIARDYQIGLDSKTGVIKYGGHEDQLSRKYPLMDEYRLRALEKHINDQDLEPGIRWHVVNEAINKVSIILKGTQNRNKNPHKWTLKLKELNKIKSILEEM